MKTKKNSFNKTKIKTIKNNNNNYNVNDYDDIIYVGKHKTLFEYIRTNIVGSSYYKNKVIKPKKYLTDIADSVEKDLHVKIDNSRMKSYLVHYDIYKNTFKNTIQLLIYLYPYTNVIYVYKYNNLLLYKDDFHYAIRMEVEKRKPEELYISNINKFDPLTGAELAKIAVRIARSLPNKKISIYDAARIEVKKLTYRKIPLSIHRLIAKDKKELSWYNTFGFSIDKTSKNQFYNLDKIHKDLESLKSMSVSTIYKFMSHVDLSNSDIKYIYYYQNYDEDMNTLEYLSRYNDLIKKVDLQSLFEKVDSHKDLTLKEFINTIDKKETATFYELFFEKNLLLIGLLKNRYFIKSPFYKYLYMLKYIGEDRSIER